MLARQLLSTNGHRPLDYDRKLAEDCNNVVPGGLAFEGGGAESGILYYHS